MKTFGKVVLTTTILSGVSLLSYGLYKRQQELLYDYDFRVKAGKLKISGPASATLQLMLIYENKSNIQIYLPENQDLNASLNNKFIGKIHLDKPYHILKKSVNQIPVTVQFSPVDTLATLAQLYDATNLTLALTGNILIRNYGFNAKIPVDLSYKLSDLVEQWT